MKRLAFILGMVCCGLAGLEWSLNNQRMSIFWAVVGAGFLALWLWGGRAEVGDE